jgi:predicted nuclease of predicted toxin-antitoxin system
VKVKLDENLPADAAALLTELGHEVDTVVTEGLAGAIDRAVLAAATSEGRVLFTLDRGLGDIRAYAPGTHGGIVVLRVDDQATRALLMTLQAFVENHDVDGLAGCLVIVRGHLVRIRRPE